MGLLENQLNTINQISGNDQSLSQASNFNWNSIASTQNFMGTINDVSELSNFPKTAGNTYMDVSSNNLYISDGTQWNKIPYSYPLTTGNGSTQWNRNYSSNPTYTWTTNTDIDDSEEYQEAFDLAEKIKEARKEIEERLEKAEENLNNLSDEIKYCKDNKEMARLKEVYNFNLGIKSSLIAIYEIIKGENNE